MKNRYILCDCASGDWGKSNTLKKLVDVFEVNYLDFIRKEKKKGVNDKRDIWCVFQSVKTNKTIVIQTEGDYYSSFKQTEYYLKTHSVDIFVCASKCENSNAYRAVESISHSYNMNIIRFRNYHNETNDNLLEVLLSEQMAQSMYNLILQLMMK